MTYTAITKKRAGPAKGARSRTRSQIENTLRAGDYPKPRTGQRQCADQNKKGGCARARPPKDKRGGGTIHKAVRGSRAIPAGWPPSKRPGWWPWIGTRAVALL